MLLCGPRGTVTSKASAWLRSGLTVLLCFYKTDFILQWVSVLILTILYQNPAIHIFINLFVLFFLILMSWLEFAGQRLFKVDWSTLCKHDNKTEFSKLFFLPLRARIVMLRCSGCMIARRTNVLMGSSKQTYKLKVKPSNWKGEVFQIQTFHHVSLQTEWLQEISCLT